jgi:subtilisin family serine protease
MSANLGAGVVIAVIDSGIDLDHPTLMGNIADAVSVIPDSAYGDGGYFDPDYQGAQDYEGHGSHIAGILVGQTEEMTLGIAPNAQILSIKALEKYGFSAAGTTEWMIRAILYAISQQVDIINLSIGGGKSYVSAAQVALRQAADAGILVVTATGNSVSGPAEGIDYPAAYENTLAVTSVTVEGTHVTLSDFSRYGAGTDLSAPGVAIYSCNADGLYEIRSGTSMSCAIVSGIAALLLSENPSLTPLEVTWLLKQSAHDAGTVGYDTVFGWGVVDAAAALRLLQSGKATTQAVEPEIPVALPEEEVPADQDWLQTQTDENRTQVPPERSAQISPETGWISPILFALAGFAIVACGVFFLHRNSAKKRSAS